MSDSYTGVRTRDNIVEEDDFSERIATLKRTITANLNETAESHAFERNLVPAEDVPAHERIAQLKQLVADMEHDWKTLNGFFNKTAQTRDWCSEYEDRLHNYNTYFKVLRMVGRPDNWYGSMSCWRSVDGGE